jgi:hypothetical protein
MTAVALKGNFNPRNEKIIPSIHSAPIQPIILEDDGNLLLLAGTNGVAGSAFQGG